MLGASLPRIPLAALAVLATMVVATPAAAQDRPHKPRAETKVPTRSTKPKRKAPQKRAVRRRVQAKRSKRQRDAADDALFDDHEAPDGMSEAERRRRDAISSDGPWPGDEDGPWATDDSQPWSTDEDPGAADDELFDDDDDDGPRATPAAPPVCGKRSPRSTDWSVHTGPNELDYDDGAEVPDGYVKQTRIRKGLVIGGAVTFGVSWLATATYAATLRAQEEQEAFWNDHEHDDGPGDEAALYIPLAGPWIALGTMDPDEGQRGALIASGVVQAGGMAMLIAGVAAKQTVLVRHGNTTVGLTPALGPSHNGFVLSGSF